MLVAGIDCGTRNTKAVVLNNSDMIGKAILQTRFERKKIVQICFEKAIASAGVERKDISGVALVGKNLKEGNEDFVRVEEWVAMVNAGCFFHSPPQIVLDAGAETTRVVKIDNQGKILDFSMNDRCAAGAGAFLETMARIMEITIEELGEIIPQRGEGELDLKITSQCAVFAETEVVGFVHRGAQKEKIAMAINDAIGQRIASMLMRFGIGKSEGGIRSVGLSNEAGLNSNDEKVLVVTGGVAMNRGFIESLKNYLELNYIFVPPEPLLANAIGAALSLIGKNHF